MEIFFQRNLLQKHFEIFTAEFIEKQFRKFLIVNFRLLEQISKFFTAEFIEKKFRKFFTVNFIEKQFRTFFGKFEKKFLSQKKGGSQGAQQFFQENPT